MKGWCPCRAWMSEPQIPTAAIRTSASPAAGTGTGAVATVGPCSLVTMTRRISFEVGSVSAVRIVAVMLVSFTPSVTELQHRDASTLLEVLPFLDALRDPSPASASLNSSVTPSPAPGHVVSRTNTDSSTSLTATTSSSCRRGTSTADQDQSATWQDAAGRLLAGWAG